MTTVGPEQKQGVWLRGTGSRAELIRTWNEVNALGVGLGGQVEV